ncbi:glucose 1-dehydrogenase [Bradyrhizobium canariense]|uniref:SDR family NAD(P)-dependent oxidoreductase n=1 Tax=Bradyrhizobium canariense TaxID=255045 RepID=UPI001CA54C81|nr:glucose 1-dehydrogenase [Bradyrhizobium canariense]MBW5435773.1 glucose 1-dehydrogenase [Bradyrhizobium canariense]
MILKGETARLFDLTGRVAVVTGATRGIGYAIAQSLGEAGARIIVSSENEIDCNNACEQLADLGIDAVPLVCNLAEEEAIDHFVVGVVHKFSVIDILVCNGGIEGPVGPMELAPETEIDRVFAINLRGALRLTSRFIPRMADAGGGSVLLIGSIAGLRGNKAIGIYGLTKAAIAQLARNLAVQWGPRDIRVNCLSPGLIDTDFAKAIQAHETAFARRMSLTPLRRMGAPQEVAAAALFLCSAAGAFITGHNLVVDGGTVITDGN